MNIRLGCVCWTIAAQAAIRLFTSGRKATAAVGEHEEVWGRLVTGWLHKVSSPTKQSCETPSFAETHPIRI
jgi:hypothetical protein